LEVFVRKMANAILNYILICTLLSSCQTREAKLAEEALALGRKKVEPYFIKCGESWYVRRYISGKEYGFKDLDEFIEARSLEYIIRSEGPLTEADRSAIPGEGMV